MATIPDHELALPPSPHFISETWPPGHTTDDAYSSPWRADGRGLRPRGWRRRARGGGRCSLCRRRHASVPRGDDEAWCVACGRVLSEHYGLTGAGVLAGPHQLPDGARRGFHVAAATWRFLLHRRAGGATAPAEAAPG